MKFTGKELLPQRDAAHTLEDNITDHGNFRVHFSF